MYARSCRSGVPIARARSVGSSSRWFLTSTAVVMVAWGGRIRCIVCCSRSRPRLPHLRSGQLRSERGDLHDRGADERMARGDDLLAQVGHVGGVVAQGGLHRERTLGLEELEVLADVGGGLGGGHRGGSRSWWSLNFPNRRVLRSIRGSGCL